MKKNHIIIMLATLSILCRIESLSAKDGCIKGWRKNKDGVCLLDTPQDLKRDRDRAVSNATTTNQAQNDDKYQSMMAAAIQQSFIDQFSALAAAGITNIADVQIPTISKSVIPFITNDQIIQFKPSHIALLTPAQINTMLPGQIAAFTSSQSAALTLPQIATLLPAHIAAMPVSQLNIVLPKLSGDQVKALIQKQIQGLSFFALGNLIPNLTNTQIPYILASQIQGLSPAHIARITSEQINSMTKAQLDALSTILQNSNVITTSNNPNLARQLSAIHAAPANQIVVEVAPPTPTIEKIVHKKLSGIDASNAKAASDIKKSNKAIKDFFTKGKIK